MGDEEELDIFLIDNEHSVAILAPHIYIESVKELENIEYFIYYDSGRFYFRSKAKDPLKEIDQMCEQLGKLGYEFAPMRPRLLYGQYIEPSGETRLMLILKGIIDE